MRKSISVTFFSMVATLLVLGTAVLGCSEWLLFSRYFAQERYDTLDSVADVTQRAADYIVQQAALPKGAELDALNTKLEIIGESAEAYLFFTDEEGRVLIASNPEMVGTDVVGPELMEKVAGDQPYHTLSTLDGVLTEKSYVSVRHMQDAQGNNSGYLFLCSSGARLTDFKEEFWSNFFFSACIMLLCASVLTSFLMRKLTDPLQKITDAAQRFGGGDFSVRVEGVEGEGEVVDLARTFNQMAENIQSNDNSRGQFMGNIAHELRTPHDHHQGLCGRHSGRHHPARYAEPLPAAGQRRDRPPGPAHPEHARSLQAGKRRVSGERPDVQHLGDAHRCGPFGGAAHQ